MQYAITFFEGTASFISPCMLPMLPVYISYFGGSDGRRVDLIARSTAFVAGFTAVFCLLGVFAGTVGSLLLRYRHFVSAVCGAVMVVFGLSYLGLIKIDIFKGIRRANEVRSISSAFIFGAIFSVSMTPCSGPMLGSALMLAGSEGGAAQGALLLAAYSFGLGIPFMISAVAMERIKGSFDLIQRHYSAVTRICGSALIIIGVITSIYN